MKIALIALAALGAGLYALKNIVPQNAVSDTLDSLSSSVSDTAQNLIAPVMTAFGTKYDDLINSSAAAAGIEPGVLYKLLYAESHFRDDIITGRVRSRTGALGIAQFMPATAAQELGSVDAALDPSQAIPGAAMYLAKLIHSTGSVVGGVAAYNWGVGNVLHKGLTKAPAETVAYVKNITGVNLA
jgi:soluble lytic murein transglycosylase-like protein